MKKNQFRILHLRKSEGFYGAERVILELARFFNNHVFSCWIGVLNDVREPCVVLYEKAREKEIPAKIFWCQSRLDLRCIAEIVKTIKTLKIDLIHAHGFKADVYGWISARCTGIPIVSTQHGWTHKNRWIRLWEAISVYFLKKMDKIIGVSPQILKALESHNILSHRLEWIPNGVPIPSIIHSASAYRKKKFGINPNIKTIGIIGRLSIEKGHTFFLEAVKHVDSVFPNLRVFIIGEGPLKTQLTSQVHAMGLDSIVHFLGFRSDMDRLYPLLDIVVLSSIREGFPLTLLEAMAYGKPVVATKVGGAIQLIQHGVNGLLVDPEDEKALANAIQYLLMYPEKARQMGKSARNWIQKQYSVENMCERYQQIYELFFSQKT